MPQNKSRIEYPSDREMIFTRVNGQELIAFNDGPHVKFTCAISLFVHGKTQREIDYYWTRLLQGGEASQGGWLTDQFGLSWQIVPEVLPQLIGDKNPAKAERAMQAMLKMSKLDIKARQQAHRGR